MTVQELERIALNGNVKLQYEIGMMFKTDEEELDYNKAYKYLLMAAQNGYSDAQCELGVMYCMGQIVSLNYEEGFKWLIKASEQNNDYAQGNLGYMYENGIGVERDLKKAFNYYLLAAKNGNEKAIETIQYMYRNGIGVSQNESEAKAWEIRRINLIKERGAVEECIAMYEKGVEYMEEGEFINAEKCYKETLRLAEKHNLDRSNSLFAEIAIELGECYYEKKEFDVAKDYFYDAINYEIGMKNPYVFLGIGKCWIKSGDDVKAKEYLIKAYMLGGKDIFQYDEKTYELIREIVEN